MPVPKRAVQEAELEDLIAAAGTPEPPTNLGNVPSEQPPAQPAAEEAPAPEPQMAPAPSVPADEPDEEPTAAPATDWERRLETLERENEFLRQAATRPATPTQPTAPADPIQLIDQMLGGFRVTEQDVQTILQDPKLGAEYFMNGIRAAVAAGASLSLQRAREEFWQYQQAQQGSQQLAQLFYGENPDLAPYAKLVEQEATAARQQGFVQASALVKETARRVRAQLREWGVTPNKTAASPAAPRAERRQPARAEGHGRGVNGRTSLNAFERELFQLANR